VEEAKEVGGDSNQHFTVYSTYRNPHSPLTPQQAIVNATASTCECAEGQSCE